MVTPKEEKPVIDDAAGSRPPSETTTVDFDQPDSLVGRKLDGRFFIEKNLTEGGADAGGIGVVYLAKDTKLMGKDVVVKILNEAALKHPDIVRKFEHEKEALIRLDHPGIVRILDSGTLIDGNPFMVMDYIKGHSLRKAIQIAGRLPLDVAANIIESVTDALTAAHSEKILHRDIKPENIMLTPGEEGFYRVRLIDFGIARVGDSKLAPATEISRAIGSVLYIAPEQLVGDLDLTPAADIFATAIVAYEMLTGELPFKPKSIAEMYKLEREGVQIPPSTLRPDMPREAERILLSALEFEPEKRPQIARAFGRYLAHELRVDSQETDRFYASVKTEFSKSPTQLMPVPDASDFETVPRVTSKPASRNPFQLMKWVVPSVLVLILLSIPAIYLGWNALQTPSPAKPQIGTTIPTDTVTERQFTYFLMVQKMRNGKTYEAPYKSSGKVGVERGYSFSIFLSADADGFMYVFSEGKDEKRNVEHNILFPGPKTHGGISKVSADGRIEIPNDVVGSRGTEIIWMIWTKEINTNLEQVIKSAYASKGVVTGASVQVLQGFFAGYDKDKINPINDAANQQTIVKVSGDQVVYRFEIEHQ